MKILITGSNGFIASHIVKYLLDSTNFEILASSKSADKLLWSASYPLYSFLKWDIEEKIDFKKLLEFKPDIIIHSAAMGSADECELNKPKALEINFHSAKTIVDLANKLNAKLIFLSTDFVFSGKDGHTYSESDVPAPVNFYGTTKLLAEEYITSYSIDFCIVRLCAVYGNAFAGKARGIITLTCERLGENKQINVVGDQVRTPTYVEDISRAIYAIILNNAKGIYHISGEQEYTPYQMATAAAEYFNLNTSLIKEIQTIALNEPAQRPQHTGFIISKAKRELNFNPTSLLEGISKMITSNH